MAILSFIKPDKILVQKTTDFEGDFEFKPLEPGFGVTVGNALRRVLLSSLEGYSIVSVKAEGVDHEFSTIEGVIEDFTEIVLNLKQIRLKDTVKDLEDEQETIYISISGKEEFKASDIEKATNRFQVMNPDLVICRMENWVKLELELIVNRGRGYVPAEELKLPELPKGHILMDAIYTPIKKVSYHVENTRVEQKTDFEKLTLHVKTDGTINPEDAVKNAARILIQHFMLISDENITFDSEENKIDNVVDEHILHMRKLLKTSLEDLELSVRAYNCLKAAKINTLGELVEKDIPELLKFRNFGNKSLEEIQQLLDDKGLNFGMDISKYKLNEE
jgi:DNA-directed RNA polymerase subunit alpha